MTCLAVEEIRRIIEQRNQNECPPKFIVRPRAKKDIEEGKSLRLKTAISANPMPTVSWDKNGIILETGSKYSIYNDGDFYYLEIHHVTESDSAFYNCTATNTHGIATASSEVEVIGKPCSTFGSARMGLLYDNIHARLSTIQTFLSARGKIRSTIPPNFIEVLPGRVDAVVGESLTVECSVAGKPTPSIAWVSAS